MTSIRRISTTLSTAVAVLIAGAVSPAATPLAAQTGPDLESAGLAGAFMGFARGYESLYWNPANLALEDGPLWTIGLPTVGLTGTLAGPPIRELGVLASDDITDTDRADLLAQVPAAGMHLRGDAQVPIIGLSIGNLAFTASGSALVDASAGRELVDLLLYTRQYGDIDYDRMAEYRVGDTGFRSSRSLAFSVGYGYALETVALGGINVGATARYVHGLEHQRGRVFEPEIDIATSDFAVPILNLRSPSGSGFGLDVGAAAQPIPGLTVGIAIENLVQRMNWDESLELMHGELSGSEIGDLGPTELLDLLETETFDPTTAPVEAFDLADALFEESFAPRVVRLGGSYDFPTGTTVGGTFSTTQGAGDLHAGWPRYFAVGVEQRLPMIATLRGGIATSFGGATALTVGTTLGFGPVKLNIAGGRLGAGSASPIDDPHAFRFANRLESGAGYSLGLGVELRSF